MRNLDKHFCGKEQHILAYPPIKRAQNAQKRTKIPIFTQFYCNFEHANTL